MASTSPSPSPSLSSSLASVKRNAEGLITTDIGVPYTHHFLDLPTVRYHYIKCAAPADPSSPPLIFIHGWPDFWYSWRHQLPVFSTRSLCICVDQRGFGYTTVKVDTEQAEQYSLANAAKDVIALMDAEHIDKAVMIVHDWGGAVGWVLARRYTSRVSGVVSLCTPYFRRREQNLPLIEIVKAAPRFSYQLYLSLFRSYAAKEFSADLPRFFNIIMRTSDPEQRLSLGYTMGALTLFGNIMGPVPRSKLLQEEELATLCAMFEHTGFLHNLLWYSTHQINWRENDMTEQQLMHSPTSSLAKIAAARGAAAADESVDNRSLSVRVTQPALMITAADDPVLAPVLANGMENMCDDYQRVDIMHASHWVHQEQATQVNEAIAQFLQKLSRRHQSADAANSQSTGPSRL